MNDDAFVAVLASEQLVLLEFSLVNGQLTASYPLSIPVQPRRPISRSEAALFLHFTPSPLVNVGRLLGLSEAERNRIQSGVCTFHESAVLLLEDFSLFFQSSGAPPSSPPFLSQIGDLMDLARAMVADVKLLPVLKILGCFCSHGELSLLGTYPELVDLLVDVTSTTLSRNPNQQLAHLLSSSLLAFSKLLTIEVRHWSISLNPQLGCLGSSARLACVKQNCNRSLLVLHEEGGSPRARDSQCAVRPNGSQMDHCSC